MHAGTQVRRQTRFRDTCIGARAKEERRSWCPIFAVKSAVKHYRLPLKSGCVSGWRHILLDILLYGVSLTSFWDRLAKRVFAGGQVCLLRFSRGFLPPVPDGPENPYSFIFMKTDAREKHSDDRWRNSNDPSRCEQFRVGGCCMRKRNILFHPFIPRFFKHWRPSVKLDHASNKQLANPCYPLLFPAPFAFLSIPRLLRDPFSPLVELCLLVL